MGQNIQFEDNTRLLVLKMTLFMKEFQIWPLGMELWDKMFNFEDDIKLLVFKMIVSKRMTAFCKGMFQIWPIGMEL